MKSRTPLDTEREQLTGPRGSLRRLCKTWLEHDRMLYATEVIAPPFPLTHEVLLSEQQGPRVATKSASR